MQQQGRKPVTDILLVDDDQDYLHQFGRFLKGEGLSVHSALSGEEAVACMEQQTYRVLITDLNMPGMDGLSLSRKAAITSPKMPVIMITGSILPEIPWLAEEAGIAKVLAKAVNPEELLMAIREVLEI